MLPLWLALALAGPTQTVEGFHRLHLDPEAVSLEPAEPAPGDGFATLVLDNPHTALAVVRVGDQPVGELLPRARGRVLQVPAGRYAVRWQLPGGIVRTASVEATPDEEPDAR